MMNHNRYPPNQKLIDETLQALTFVAGILFVCALIVGTIESLGVL